MFVLTKLEATLYALTHRGNPGDCGFYAKACARGQQVLELGSGYGRLMADLLVGAERSGPNPRYWGLEQDPQLLTLARRALHALSPAQRKQVRLVQGNMCNFELERQFDRIILPYNGLYCLLNHRDILRCLRCVKRHLAPGGEFVFDVWAADRFHRDANSEEYHDDPGAILSIATGANTWNVFEKSRLRSRLQRLDVTYAYVSPQHGRCVTIPIAQRYARSSELIDLLSQAGLFVRAKYGSFTKRQFHAESAHLIVRAGLASP